MKKTMKMLLASLGLLLVLGGVFFYIMGNRYVVVITQEQIDEALSERFPLTKRHYMIFNITYSNPEVRLLEEVNRIQVGLDAGLNLLVNGEMTELSGGATVTFGIRYAPEAQVFFLDDAVFTRLDIPGVPERILDQVKAFASIAAQEVLETVPVYRLEAKDVKTTAAKLLLKDFEVRDQAIHVTLGL